MEVDGEAVEVQAVGSGGQREDGVGWATYDAKTLGPPPTYDGKRDIDAVEMFLRQINDHMDLAGHSGLEAVRLAGHCLRGEASLWWWNVRGGARVPPGMDSMDAFCGAVVNKFVPGGAAAASLRQLQALQQGTLAAHEYNSRFQSLARRAGLSEEQQMAQYIQGLPPLKQHFVTAAFQGRPPGLHQLMAYNEQCDALLPLAPADTRRAVPSMRPQPAYPADPEPMDIGQVEVQNQTKAVMEALLANVKTWRNGAAKDKGQKSPKRCFYCDKLGHVAKDCYQKQADKAAKEKKGKKGNARAPSQRSEQ